jgi:hypothetical protein
MAVVTKKVRRHSRKPQQRWKRPHRRYFWAAHFSPGDPELAPLSKEARSGLAYASTLAEHAAARARSALDGVSLAPLTVEELAEDDFRSPIQVRKEIKQARIELFGRDLTDSAIAYRLKKRRERGVRSCAEPKCGRPIPALANGRRRYCDLHSTPAARVRRHRHGTAGFAPVRPRRSRSNEPSS